MPKRLTPQGIKKDTVRLNKALAMAGVCSRRAADELIAAGRVTVNSIRADAGQQVDTQTDIIAVDNVQIFFQSVHTEHSYIMLHKPIQVVCTAKDPQGRETVLDILPEQWRSLRIYPVGRLDYFSEGLLLLTDDGDLTFRLTHPSQHIPRIYEVNVRGKLTEEKLNIMRNGMKLSEGEKLAPVEVEVISQQGDKSVLKMTLHQGINRQIRRMCRDTDLTIIYLRRLQMGPLKLGDLEKGEARPLSEQELNQLRKAVGIL